MIVLAGFLVMIPAAMTEKYKGRIINIHPSLIPSFCGVGYYGLKVHEAALARGVKVTGATVHYVDGGMAVSYTHLDVYKRQTMRNTGAGCIALGVIIAVTGLTVGIISIVNGALLLKRKSEIEF